MSDSIVHLLRDGFAVNVNDIIAEIDRLRAENAELRKALRASWPNQDTTPDFVRAILAKTASDLPASDQERQKSS